MAEFLVLKSVEKTNRFLQAIMWYNEDWKKTYRLSVRFSKLWYVEGQRNEKKVEHLVVHYFFIFLIYINALARASDLKTTPQTDKEPPLAYRERRGKSDACQCVLSQKSPPRTASCPDFFGQ